MIIAIAGELAKQEAFVQRHSWGLSRGSQLVFPSVAHVVTSALRVYEGLEPWPLPVKRRVLHGYDGEHQLMIRLWEE
jgi:hypothetical protein